MTPEWKVISDGARVIQVIETNMTNRGRGIEGDPIRRIRQFWSLDGHLLAEVDDWKEQQEAPNGV